MSAPLTVARIDMIEPKSGAVPGELRVVLSNQRALDPIVYSIYDSPAVLMQQVANAVVAVNQVAYWHPLTPGMINALLKFRRAVIENEGRPVHLLKDMKGKAYELSPHEWNNFTKLRFHGLAVKMGDGHWQLHWRASDFLRGKISLPAKVKTLNNEVVDHDDLHVFVEDVMARSAYWDTMETVETEYEPTEPVQTEMFAGAVEVRGRDRE